VRLKTSTHCCMSEIALHSEKLGLSMILSIVQLDSLSLHVGQLVLVRLVPMDISDHPRVFKVNESVVDKEATSRGRVEEVEVSVLDPSMVEVGRGKGPSMEGGRILVFSLAAYSYEVSVFPNAPVRNVLSCFCLSLFIEEDNGIKVRLSTIIPYPPFARVIRVLKVTSERRSKANGLRGGCGPSDRGLVLCEASRLVTVNAVLTHIWLSEV